MFLPASWLISFKLRAQGIANLVLLPSRPDTVRKDALALRPNGKKRLYTIFRSLTSLLSRIFFLAPFFLRRLLPLTDRPKELLEHLTGFFLH